MCDTSSDNNIILTKSAEFQSAVSLQKRIQRLIPSQGTTYQCSVIAMIISKVISDFPVYRISDEQLFQEASLLDLYKTIKVLIERYQKLCDEILQVLLEVKIQDSFYGSAWLLTDESHLPQVNRKLLSIATDIRDISKSLDGILNQNTALYKRFKDFIEICPTIGVLEDFLVIQLDTRLDSSRETSIDQALWGVKTDVVSGQPISDNVHTPEFEGNLGEQMVHDFHYILAELDDYKVQLEQSIAKLASNS